MKVLVIDDHPIVRAGCVQVLKQRENLDVSEADTAEKGLALAHERAPEIVILDLNLPDRRGLEVLQEIRRVMPRTMVIIFSMYEEAAFVTSAMENGARGYVSKNDDPDSLLEAIDQVSAGKLYLSRVVEQRLARAQIEPDTDVGAQFTRRQRRLMDLLAEGKTLAEAAFELNISYRTTAEEAARLRTRLKLRTNAGLIKFAVQRQGGGDA